MLWEAVLIGANEDLDNIPKQFISVKELLEIFADCENMTHERAAQWFINNIRILNRTKKLILKNEHTLVEYEQNDNNFYGCPIGTIRLIADGGDYDPFSDCVGFARYTILKDLKNEGLDIDDSLINNSCAYHSKNCYEHDDNFYKNQSSHLKEELDSLTQNDSRRSNKNNGNIQFIHFLDFESQSYVPKFALLLRLHHDLVYVGRYDNETKTRRVEMFLEEYGREYNVQSSTAQYYSNLLTTRDKSKKSASEAIKKALSDQS